MKSAVCTICGALLIQDRAIVMPPIITNGEPASKESTDGMLDVAEFDLLAGKAAQHLSLYHPDHAQEMAAVGFLASKVYAMTWTNPVGEASEEQFNGLRTSWRDAILNELRKTYRAGAPADGAGSSPSPPAGS